MKVRLKFFAFFILLPISFYSFGQRTEVMVLGGLNGSRLNHNGNTDSFKRLYSPTIGLLAGIGGEYTFFETGLLFSTRGAALLGKVKEDSTKLRMNYLDIPFMIVIAPERFRFFLGPQLSLLSSAKLSDGTKVTNGFEKKNWGLRYGAGYNSRKLTLQLHFITGLTDINKTSLKWKDSAFQINLGYLIFRNFQPSERKKKETDDDIIPKHRKID